MQLWSESTSRKWFICLSFLTLSGLAGQSHGETRAATISAYLIRVDSPNIASTQIIDKANSLGGYFVERSNLNLKLRIPYKQLNTLVNFLKQQGEVVNKEYTAKDVNTPLRYQQSILNSKESVVQEYIDVLNQSKTDKLIIVEKEVAKLIGDIELSKGKIRFLQYQLDFAQVNVDFTFRDRSAPKTVQPSSFPWLNTISLVSLLEDFKNADK